jgi:hypothetical protein
LISGQARHGQNDGTAHSRAIGISDEGALYSVLRLGRSGVDLQSEDIQDRNAAREA